jgi:ribosomal protein L11 methyltransferase
MEWFYYTITTTTEAEDLVSSVLYDFGITNIEIIDGVVEDDLTQGRVYEELLPDDIRPDDGSAQVRFYVDSDRTEEERNALLSDIKAELESYALSVDIGPASIESGVTKDVEWRDKWKEFFHEFDIGSFHIAPAWEKSEDVDVQKKQILIDPGVAFGTGKHESTMLCIRGLEKYMKEGDRVLDIGCGSGILSIVASKMGASEVLGTDINDEAIESCQANFELNGIEFDEKRFFVGDLGSDESVLDRLGRESYDVICANLLADIIETMIDEMYALLKVGGYVITSGIIDFRADELAKKLGECGFTVLEKVNQGEWVSLVLTK